jgi:hypothetical protein
MPRIYKGTETMLRLLIDVNTTEPIDKLKIALFTTDRTKAVECYSDSINLHGNIAYVTVYEWTFLDMEDGLINYVATGEIDNKPFITERQSNYILKSTDEYDQSDIMNGYYTKAEVDVRLDAEQDLLVSGKTIKTINGESVLGAGNIKIEMPDLTGYATEKWVKDQDYATNSDVNEEINDKLGEFEQKFTDYYTKEEVDNKGYLTEHQDISGKQDVLVSGQNIKTINGEDILGEGDIVIKGGGGSGDSGELYYPIIHGPQIYGEMQFFEDYGYYEDTSSGIANGFKMNRATINNLWVKNLHTGTGGETVKVTSSDEDGYQVYAEFTAEGIRENGKYLSDKYATKAELGDINNILSSI